MRLKNILITVNDLNQAKQFYKELFGLESILDNGGNIILTEGLVLQDRRLWEQAIERELVSHNNGSVLYFEERDMEGFLQKLEKYSVQYVSPLTEDAFGRKMLRFYDLDGNLIEVGSPWR